MYRKNKNRTMYSVRFVKDKTVLTRLLFFEKKNYILLQYMLAKLKKNSCNCRRIDFSRNFQGWNDGFDSFKTIHRIFIVHLHTKLWQKPKTSHTKWLRSCFYEHNQQSFVFASSFKIHLYLEAYSIEFQHKCQSNVRLSL